MRLITDSVGLLTVADPYLMVEFFLFPEKSSRREVYPQRSTL